MAYESIKVDIIPGAENAEVLHFSQYDNKRPFFIELFNGGAEFIPESGMSITLECKKRDGNIVILSDPVLNDNVAEFSTTEQMTACYGDNTAEIKIVDDNDLVIGSANFIINVEKSPTCGGLVSESEIDNLTQQIAAIVPEVISEDYYNKTQTDALLADKANRSELSALASKAELEYAIEEEDAAVKDWVSSHFATPGYVADRYYNKTQVDELLDNIFPTLEASGAIASFITALNKPLVSVTHEAGATTITRCGKNLINNDNAEIGRAWNGNSASNRARLIIPCDPSTNYVLTMNGTMTVDGVYFCESETIPPSEISAVIFPKIFTTASTSKYITLGFNKTNISQADVDGLKLQLEKGSTATAYEPYRGQKVPVADATSLTTLSGVNNVFADTGDVTVQYKYMSI